MQRNLSKNNDLLVISDTGIVKTANGYKAFGPVVKELFFLLEEFESITWIGFHKKNQIDNKSYIKVDESRIKILTLPNVGGKSILKKIEILLYYPIMSLQILNEILKHKKIHTRGPSNPAIISMFFSLFFPNKIFWHKYAGSWIDEAPFFYDLQRKFLKNLTNNNIITVNGDFSNKKNILSFENPCLEEKDRRFGKKIISTKKLDNLINFCFVGGLNSNKGADKIIEAFLVLDSDNVGTIHIVGDGELRQKLIDLSLNLEHKIIFHGFLPKNKISKIYEKTHFILLPSKSEGFPKVIGEAMNYGCIPIVSDVSCISQYIKDKENGFLIWPITNENIKKGIFEALTMNSKKFEEIIQKNFLLAEKFTYSYYIKRINSEIFKLK